MGPRPYYGKDALSDNEKRMGCVDDKHIHATITIAMTGEHTSVVSVITTKYGHQ